MRQRLIEARKAAGLTQEVVANRVGRPQSFVAKVETGERALDFVELIALAAVVGLDLAKVIPEVTQALLSDRSN